MKITIALCTRKRPGMLTDCLQSIQRLAIPENCGLSIALVENDNQPLSENTARTIMETSPGIGFNYRLETELGISTARNASIELALSNSPDWIVFIDDDETVHQDWLVHFAEAIKSGSADVYAGPVEFLLKGKAPIWYKKPVIHKHEDKSYLATAATGNTIASASFFDGRKDRLRFDVSYRFSGGEDLDLYGRLVSSGGKIQYVKDALVYEHIAEDRMTVKWMLAREFSFGNNTVRQETKHNGWLRAVKLHAMRIILRILEGFMYVLIGLLMRPFSRRGIKHLVGGLRKVMWALGCIAGFFNYKAEPYRKIEGH